MKIQSTVATQAVLASFLTQPTEELYGLEVLREANLTSGTVYPILKRLEEAGWLESRWEAIDAAEVGRPRRRLYRLTGQGALAAREMRESVARRLRLRPVEDLT